MTISRGIFAGAVVVGSLGMLAMMISTAVWMTVPTRIVYRESSLVETEKRSVEVRQHGTSYFVTPAQKQTLDRIYEWTPIVWFGGLGVAVLSILAGAAAKLRLMSVPPD